MAGDGYQAKTPPSKTAASPVIPNTDVAVSPNLIAGLLLAALPHLARLGLLGPTATAVLDATGAGRTGAYLARAAVEALLPTLQRPPGRPPVAAEAVPDTRGITEATLDYLMAHPGAVTARGSRQVYSDGFRAHALHQAAAQPDLDRRTLAAALRLPTATLDDWLAAAAPAAEPPKDAPPPTPEDPVVTARTATLLEAWSRWEGGLAAFGDFARAQLEIPWGDTRIATALAIHSRRRAKTRPGRRPDESALRGAFRTFFPGAQWSEDGSLITIDWCGQRFTFNLELVVDTASAACVGADVRDTEDTAAVIAAFQDAVSTTGAPPLALNTDNATENDGPGMAEALGDTRHIHATLGRPQNDAHVEGAFGLFQQAAPPLVITGHSPRQLAKAVLVLLITVWGRTLNHRPRASHQGKSRVDLYRAPGPTPEQIRQAKDQVAEIQRRHDQAAQTRRTRTNTTTRALLDDVFRTRGWDDPDARLRAAIAGYPIDAVLAAIAIVEAKAARKTLLADAGPRYLLAVARNIANEREGAAIADALWRRRLDAKDHILARLIAQRDGLSGDIQERLQALTERALTAPSTLARIVYQDAIADAITRQPHNQQKTHFDAVTRTVCAAYRLHPRLRQAIVRDIAERIIPIV